MTSAKDRARRAVLHTPATRVFAGENFAPLRRRGGSPRRNSPVKTVKYYARSKARSGRCAYEALSVISESEETAIMRYLHRDLSRFSFPKGGGGGGVYNSRRR